MALLLVRRTRHSTLKILANTRSLTTMSSEKIYELRTYNLRPDKFADYIKLFSENVGTRTAHSKLCGFWTTDVGDTLSQVVHIWEYDSHCHRAAVRKSLSEDKKWNTEFTPFSKPMIVKQKNVIMKPASWYEVRDPVPTGGIYELRTYTYDPSKRAEIEKFWAAIIPTRIKYNAPVGIWFSEIGPINKIYSLYSYNDGDERARIRKAAFEDKVVKEGLHKVDVHFTATHCKILLPTAFSPWN